MPIRSDKWIRKMSEEHGMIEPFEADQVREDCISYGLSSYGYDIRVAPEFKVFTNVHSVVVDPKNFDPRSFVDVRADECIIPPNSFALARTEEHFRIPRDTLVICVGKSTYARCFRGDTRVALVDGSAPTLEEMARRADDGEMFWGYSIGPFGRVEVTLLDAPRFVGRDQLLEIELDNGKRVRCTPDHEFLLRDGRLTEADRLRPGDSLMPLYRDLARGYEVVYQPLDGHLYPTHRLADEWNVRNGIYADVPGTHRHHKDHDRRNNSPWNLERMEASAHQRERALRFRHDGAYAEARERLRHGHLGSWTPEGRERRSRARRESYANAANWRWQAGETARARRAASEERRERQAEIARSLRIRTGITAEVVRRALDQAGSIRGAARLQDRDRSVFRRFPDVTEAFRGHGNRRNHEITAVRALSGDHDVYCLTVPEAGNFALDAGIFTRNCGIIVNVTPLEPTWCGYLTLEISNTTPLPAKIYAGEGIAQLLFFEGDEEPTIAYADRKGKYQDQTGVTLPRL